MGKRKTIIVAEIYRSVQDKSIYAGLPCVFVRLLGCDRGCRWCDAQNAAKGVGTDMSIEEAAAEVFDLGANLVEITGGEPLQQRHAPKLAIRLADEGCIVLVSTNGAYDISVLPPPIIRVMDIKTPSSGTADRMDWYNLGEIRPNDEVKFTIADRLDYEWAREVMEKHNLPQKCGVLLAAVADTIPPGELADWALFDVLPVRLVAPVRRLFWPESQRGS